MKIAFFPGSFKPPHIGHFTLVKKILPQIDLLYLLISSKPRDGITAEQSKKIWDIYLSKNDLNKIKILITPKSPIFEVFSILRRDKLTPKDTIYLIKSSKNKNNKRFDMFKKLKLNIIEKNLPPFKTISSTNMRQAILNKDFITFQKFLPTHLSKNAKINIYNLLT